MPPPAGEFGRRSRRRRTIQGSSTRPRSIRPATAALLRNGHLSHGAAPDGPLAIELNSTRVRLAQSLLDGVRQGQPLSALLGYRFERRLHDEGLIPSSQRSEPSPRRCSDRGGTAEPTRQMRAVVNGLDLRQLWKDQREKLLRERVGIQEMHPSWQRLVDALDALDEALDAVADAVSAESVHQFVRGNMMRAGATLSAIASGQAPAPEARIRADAANRHHAHAPRRRGLRRRCSHSDGLGGAGAIAARGGRARPRGLGGKAAGSA